ncbi:hypothetical protein BOX15_Mlig001235g2, partial [Macrostomum lignano]
PRRPANERQYLRQPRAEGGAAESRDNGHHAVGGWLPAHRPDHRRRGHQANLLPVCGQRILGRPLRRRSWHIRPSSRPRLLRHPLLRGHLSGVLHHCQLPGLPWPRPRCHHGLKQPLHVQLGHRRQPRQRGPLPRHLRHQCDLRPAVRLRVRAGHRALGVRLPRLLLLRAGFPAHAAGPRPAGQPLCGGQRGLSAAAAAAAPALPPVSFAPARLQPRLTAAVSAGAAALLRPGHAGSRSCRACGCQRPAQVLSRKFWQTGSALKSRYKLTSAPETGQPLPCCVFVYLGASFGTALMHLGCSRSGQSHWSVSGSLW